MLSDRLDDLAYSDIEAFRDNKISEGKSLEYKRDLYGRSDEDRRELVADVTAFANAEGGDIIFGVSEGGDGTPNEICGVTVADRDEEERRLSDTIRMGTEPRYASFEFKWIETTAEKPVLVLRAARSWRRPHRVTLRGHDKFYVRNARGKHPMNTEELRSAFLLGETLIDRIRSFRKERNAMIRNNEAPLPIDQAPIAVLHLVPLISIADPLFLKFEDYENIPRPMGEGYGFNRLETLDGKVSYSPQTGDEPVSAYTLVFRSGIIEAVLNPGSSTDSGKTQVAVGYLEQCLVECVPSYLSYLQQKGVSGPYYLLLSLLNVQGTVFEPERGRGRALAIQRQSNLMFPELVFNSVEQENVIATSMKPICDLLWNAFGYPRSWNFTPEGEWKPRV